MDHRDKLAMFGSGDFPPDHGIDQNKMVVTFWIDDGEGDEPEEHSLNLCFEVCSSCSGKGSYVNPSIDSHGLSREDFEEDPDFAEDYMSGAYDVCCRACNGKRVIPEIAEGQENTEAFKVLESWREAFYDDVRERESEMRWGY